MVSTSKVLTVSYGTFSCTLEGFDDSFDTMKAIAEYFRDLAADDRYFGAEPPTPDAEMLARIAEKEVARRVEASFEGDNIVLRTALPAAATAAAAPAQAPLQAEASPQDLPLQNTDADPAPSDEGQDAEDIAETSLETAVIAQTEHPTEDETTLVDRDGIAATDVAPDASEPIADAPAVDLSSISDSLSGAADGESAEMAAQIAPTDTQDTADASEDVDTSSIAAKLARIRAVVGTPETSDTGTNYSEDEHADEILETLPGDTDLEDILPADADADVETSQDDTIAAVMGKIAADEAAEEPLEPEEPQASVAEIEALFEEEAPAEEDAALIEAETSAPDASSETLPDETTTQEAQSLADESTGIDAAQEDAAQTEPAQPRRPIRARVIKMKRAEFEKAIAEGDLEEVDDEDTASDALENLQSGDQAVEAAPTSDILADQQTDLETSLSADDEDELQRELAAVEAELASQPAAGTLQLTPDHAADVSEPDEIAYGAEEGRDSAQTRDDLAVAPEAEIDRLMSRASNHLEEPEGKQRRSAMGHLRAAVAAARADKSATQDAPPRDKTEAYRDDLEEAVKPPRPLRRVSGQPSERSAPAPLKLVAAQRVDLPQEEAATAEVRTPAQPQRPVRPRRVRGGDATRAAISPNAAPAPEATADAAQSGLQPSAVIGDAEGTFMEFAEEMGATELPDLLEAAAAYIAYVEGRDQFSRPQLMTKVRMVQEDNFSREDGLRSFGQLLRQGKIEKIAGGRFTVSDRISFKPDTRAAG